MNGVQIWSSFQHKNNLQEYVTKKILEKTSTFNNINNLQMMGMVK